MSNLTTRARCFDVVRASRPFRPHEYVIWIREQWRAWEKETGNRRPYSRKNHDAFDGWLCRRVGLETEQNND